MSFFTKCNIFKKNVDHLKHQKFYINEFGWAACFQPSSVFLVGQAVSAPPHPRGARPGQGGHYGPGAAGAATNQNPPNHAGHRLTPANPGGGAKVEGRGRWFLAWLRQESGEWRGAPPTLCLLIWCLPPALLPPHVRAAVATDRQKDRHVTRSFTEDHPLSDLEASSQLPSALLLWIILFSWNSWKYFDYFPFFCSLHNTRSSQTGIISTSWCFLYIYAMYTVYMLRGGSHRFDEWLRLKGWQRSRPRWGGCSLNVSGCGQVSVI